jgi:hypothetical protein
LSFFLSIDGRLHFNGLNPQRAGVCPEQSGEKRVKGLRQIQGEITLSILEFGAEILSGVDDVIFLFQRMDISVSRC